MTLVALTAENMRRQAQETLRRTIQTFSKNAGIQRVGFPGGNDSVSLATFNGGKFWYATSDNAQASVPRFLNTFGFYDAGSAMQTITVEINVAMRSAGADLAGFFASDPKTKQIFLMHSGKIGGGTKGVGKREFLAWMRNFGTLPLETVDEGPYGQGFRVGALGTPHLAQGLSNFIKDVERFKTQVRKGHLFSFDLQTRLVEYDRYAPEFSGRKIGTRQAEIDYLSHHGDVVDALREALLHSHAQSDVVNSQLIDLMVKRLGRMDHIYEVKSDLGRQSLYTAIGQLLTHSAPHPRAGKTLVIPEGPMPPDIADALRVLEIAVMTYTIDERTGAVRL